MPERAVIPFVRLETEFSGLYLKLPHCSPQINHCLASAPFSPLQCMKIPRSAQRPIAGLDQQLDLMQMVGSGQKTKVVT